MKINPNSKSQPSKPINPPRKLISLTERVGAAVAGAIVRIIQIPTLLFKMRQKVTKGPLKDADATKTASKNKATNKKDKKV